MYLVHKPLVSRCAPEGGLSRRAENASRPVPCHGVGPSVGQGLRASRTPCSQLIGGSRGTIDVAGRSGGCPGCRTNPRPLADAGPTSGGLLARRRHSAPRCFRRGREAHPGYRRAEGHEGEGQRDEREHRADHQKHRCPPGVRPRPQRGQPEQQPAQREQNAGDDGRDEHQRRRSRFEQPGRSLPVSARRHRACVLKQTVGADMSRSFRSALDASQCW